MPTEQETTTTTFEPVFQEMALETTSVGYQADTWNNITFGDILGTVSIFIFIIMISLLIDRLIANFKRHSRTRN